MPKTWHLPAPAAPKSKIRNSKQAKLLKDIDGPKDVENKTDKVTPEHDRPCTKTIKSICCGPITSGEQTELEDRLKANKLKSKRAMLRKGGKKSSSAKCKMSDDLPRRPTLASSKTLPIHEKLRVNIAEPSSDEKIGSKIPNFEQDKSRNNDSILAKLCKEVKTSG